MRISLQEVRDNKGRITGYRLSCTIKQDIQVSRLRKNRLTRPNLVLPRIMRTNFWDLNSARELSRCFNVLYFYHRKRRV